MSLFRNSQLRGLTERTTWNYYLDEKLPQNTVLELKVMGWSLFVEVENLKIGEACIVVAIFDYLKIFLPKTNELWRIKLTRRFTFSRSFSIKFSLIKLSQSSFLKLWNLVRYLCIFYLSFDTSYQRIFFRLRFIILTYSSGVRTDYFSKILLVFLSYRSLLFFSRKYFFVLYLLLVFWIFANFISFYTRWI